MRTSAVGSALLGVILVAGSATGVPAWAKKKGTRIASLDASACPRFSQRVDNKARTITFRLENRCELPIHCTVTWEVNCPGGVGGERRDEPLELKGGEAQSLEASAATCGEGNWQITPAAWQCLFRSEGNTATR